MMQNKKAFTLVEMMIVVAIISVLAGVALPQYNKYVRKSEVVEALGVMREITNAQMLYRINNDFYFPGDTTTETGRKFLKENLSLTFPEDGKFKNYSIEHCGEDRIRIGATTMSDSAPVDDIYSVFMLYPDVEIFIDNYVNQTTGGRPICPDI
jgi:prepilin-type N-terminal cleavage/methylation domain-containing protein